MLNTSIVLLLAMASPPSPSPTSPGPLVAHGIRSRRPVLPAGGWRGGPQPDAAGWRGAPPRRLPWSESARAEVSSGWTETTTCEVAGTSGRAATTNAARPGRASARRSLGMAGRPLRLDPRNPDGGRDGRPSTPDHRRNPAPPPPAAGGASRAPRRRERASSIPGAQEWRDGRYVWVEGHWEAERHGDNWQAGHWDRHGDRHAWHQGGWEHGGPPGPHPRPGVDHRADRRS